MAQGGTRAPFSVFLLPCPAFSPGRQRSHSFHPDHKHVKAEHVEALGSQRENTAGAPRGAEGLAGGECQAARGREEIGPRWPASPDASTHSGRCLFLPQPEIRPTSHAGAPWLQHHRLQQGHGLYLGADNLGSPQCSLQLPSSPHVTQMDCHVFCMLLREWSFTEQGHGLPGFTMPSLGRN